MVAPTRRLLIPEVAQLDAQKLSAAMDDLGTDCIRPMTTDHSDLEGAFA